MPSESHPPLARIEYPEWFATTHWSVVPTAGRSDSTAAAAALETLCRNYWNPLYTFIRRRGHDAHTAQDLRFTTDFGAFGGWWPLALTTGFVPGTNHLDFRLNDGGAISGFRIEFLPILYLTADRNGIKVHGDVGSTNRIEYASDLSAPDWTPLTNVVLTTSSMRVSDTQGYAAPRRFYRARRFMP